MNNDIEKALQKLVNEDFRGDPNFLHDWVIDAANNADIGTGKYLSDQVSDDIRMRKDGQSWTNLHDLELTKKVFDKHPNDYFVYSTEDSLGRPLTVSDLAVIKDHFANNSVFDLVPNETGAKKSLEKLA